jgi:hypothetical protein
LLQRFKNASAADEFKVVLTDRELFALHSFILAEVLNSRLVERVGDRE